MRLAPGTRLGSYEVVSGIGAGGMGEVYRAHDTVLNRDVALKLVHPDFCHHPDSLTRLRREARALAALNHPNVATLHELAEFGGSCGLVMELVGGDTLADLVRRRRLPVAEALRLAAQVAGALEAAHERGITHRDLKPANIKITGNLDAVVNSHHHQAIDSVGANLIATAWTTDGIIEAMEDPRPDRFVLAVQWHPELGWRDDALSQRLFQTFVNEAAGPGREQNTRAELHSALS